MEAKVCANPKSSYMEFEPFCNWQREEAKDVLVVHLPEFKKDQLKVQINDYGILKISGERQVNAETRSKFYKEVSVPKNCITSDIHAKFVNGCLYITMPKKVAPTPKQDKQPLSGEGSRMDQKPNKTTSQDQVKKSTSSNDTTSSSTEKSDYLSDEYTEKPLESHQQKKLTSRLKRFGKVAMNLGAIAIVVSALSAYFFYMYRSVIIED